MKKLFVVFFLVFAAAASAQTPTAKGANQAAYVRPDAEKRFKTFVSDTVGPFAWVGITAGAGFSTAVNNPKEWGKSANGFGKRFASNFGKNLIKNTAIYGLDEALKLDSHFYLSPKSNFGSRVSNAFLSTFTARKPNGKRTIGVPRIVGSYTSDIIANEAWYPARYGWKDGLKGGSMTLGVNAFFNLFREFVLKK